MRRCQANGHQIATVSCKITGHAQSCRKRPVPEQRACRSRGQRVVRGL